MFFEPDLHSIPSIFGGLRIVAWTIVGVETMPGIRIEHNFRRFARGLQRGAHLMVNYDLPWNPNRLEQRFGRIHRIGQQVVCHLWNLVAKETREGEVYYRLLTKLEIINETFKGRVFDILGEVFEEKSLKPVFNTSKT